jgi:arylsulfatase A-like enzyme
VGNQRPNVLLLYTDQQRWDALGASGNPEILTPNLDRLAASGTLFTHHFVQNPVCMPSRASFLSGMYPETLGISHMGVPLPEDLHLLPHYLRPWGYRTANIGKLHAIPHANRDHRDGHPSYGFDELEISDEPGPYEDAYRAWVRTRAPEHLHTISVGLPPSAITWRQTMGIDDPVVQPEERFPKRPIPFPAPDSLTHAAFVADRTCAFIDRQGTAPWLCIAGFYSPHSPWVVPQQFLDLYDPQSLTLPPQEARLPYDRADANRDSEEAASSDSELQGALHGYYAMVSEVDHHVGVILDRLESRGMLDTTLIVFTSDHGEWLGTYGRYGKGHPADDTISRVPLIVCAPASMEIASRRVDRIVEAVDVLPTLLESAGIPVRSLLQGHSLVPLMRAEASDHSGSAITEHRGWKTLRTERYRYLIDASGDERLFCLDEDPHQTRDVIREPGHARALAEHRRLLLQRLIARERPRTRTWTY